MSGFSGAASRTSPGQGLKYRVFGSTYTGRSSLDVPTKHLPKNQKMNGEAFFAALLNGVESRKIQVAYETPAKRLVMNDAGEAIGVVAEEKGKPVAIRAKRRSSSRAAATNTTRPCARPSWKDRGSRAGLSTAPQKTPATESRWP